MLNEMIKKMIALILSTMMAFTMTGDTVQNKGDVEDVVDTTVSATENSDSENKPDYIVEINPDTQETNPEKENDNGAATPSDEDVVVETHPSDDEHKTTVTYNPTEEDIKNKQENKEEQKTETPKVEETKPVEQEKEPVVEETKPAEPVVTFTDVNETVYATSGVNVRKGPSTDYEKIGSLNKNDAVKRIGIGSNGWSKIEYNGTVAYVSGNYLTTTKPVVETPKVEETKPADPTPEAPKKTAYDTDTVSMVNKLFGNGSVSSAYADYERQVLEAMQNGGQKRPMGGRNGRNAAPPPRDIEEIGSLADCLSDDERVLFIQHHLREGIEKKHHDEDDALGRYNGYFYSSWGELVLNDDLQGDLDKK